MRTASAIRRAVRQKILPVFALGIASVGALHAQPSVVIDSWEPEVGDVRSQDVRIRHVSETLTDFFDPGEPEEISVDKSQSFIYVRFENNSPEPYPTIPDGAVTVTAAFAPAPPGLAAPFDVAAAEGLAEADWQTIGSYTMDLVNLPGDDPDYGLIVGFPGFPTSREIGLPERYRIACTVDCAEPLPSSFFLRVSLALAGSMEIKHAFSYYDLTSGVPPADVVILHDVSGSMIGQLALAQQRAKMFVDLMNPGDRVGVVAFSTALPGNTEIAATFGTLNPIDLKAGIDSLVAGGGTPMGSGVLRAHEMLNAAPLPHRENRAIVMLTDGMENADPRLKNPPLHPILTDLNSDEIALFPLWFGALGSWGKDLLEDVSDVVTLGKVVEQPIDDLKLAKAYLMIRGILTHDDIYAIHQGTAGDGYEAVIDVDTVTDELILTASWRTFGQELEISVQPPGGAWQPAGPLATITSRDQLYVVHRFQNPPPGVWRYRLAQARRSEPYVLAALADKVEILLQSDLADNSLAAGEPLVVNARLTRRGSPVPGAVIRARIDAPEKALGTLLHEVRDRLKTPRPADPSGEASRAAGILGELREILGSDSIFTFTPGTIELRDEDGDGLYTGRFEDTRVAGTYSVTLTAESVPTEGEGFRRQHHHAAVVSLGTIDRERSIVKVIPLERSDSEGATLRAVTVIPADLFGNFIDPGYGSRLKVDATGGRWLGGLVDNQDGSYTRLLELGPGEAADVNVTAFGQKLPTAAASGRRELSFHAGFVQPTGAFDDLVDRGPSLTFDLGYRLRSRLTALLLVGAHDFALGGGGSERVLQISADLRQRLSGGRFPLYLQGGPGLYRLFGNWEGGANLGLGLTYAASAAVNLEWGLDFHNIFLPGDDARFWQLHVGSSIDF